MSNQLSLCQNVLRAVQNVGRDGKNLDRDTWESLLKFVLNVSDTLLAPPSTPSKMKQNFKLKLSLVYSTFFN